MITTEKANKLIKELEKEMISSREEDKFGYAKHKAIEVYHSVIRRLKELNIKGEVNQND